MTPATLRDLPGYAPLKLVAARLGISPTTMRRRIRQKRLRVYRSNARGSGRVLLKLDDVARFMAETSGDVT